MKKILAGTHKFETEIFPRQAAMFQGLASEQHPRALLVTCADSRIDPSLITQTVPGEIFVCRNAGNIVPPHGTDDSGEAASIEYAVAVLKVKHLIVCGHSNCGAMKGVLHPQGLDVLPRVKAWLRFSETARRLVAESGTDEEAVLRHLIEENVRLQLLHVRTHPFVAAALAIDAIQLHGWVYDIANGHVDVLDSETNQFRPIRDEDWDGPERPEPVTAQQQA